MEVSSTQVSRTAAKLDEMLEAWRTRDLGRYRYIILDAQYEKVRQGGQVLDAAVLIACGVDELGNRDVLGCAVSLSEAKHLLQLSTPGIRVSLAIRPASTNHYCDRAEKNPNHQRN